MKLAHLFLLALFVCCETLLFAEDVRSKPNIVVFISDDHSQLDSQAYGSSEVRTPNMSKLAAEGMKFTHTFVASPSATLPNPSASSSARAIRTPSGAQRSLTTLRL